MEKKSKDGSDPSQNAAYVYDFSYTINKMYINSCRKMKIMRIKEICDKIKHE